MIVEVSFLIPSHINMLGCLAQDAGPPQCALATGGYGYIENYWVIRPRAI